MSGVFVYRLVQKFRGYADIHVLTPSCLGVRGDVKLKGYRVTYCRYSPSKGENLAQLPGGIPAALKANRLLALNSFVLMTLSMMFYVLVYGRRVDVVHANWSICALIASPVRLFGVKIVTTLRGDDVSRAKRGRLGRLLLYLCVKSSNSCVTVSADMKQWVDRYIPQSKTSHVNNGVDEKCLSLEREYTDTGDITFVYVGNLIRRKRIDILLDALSEFRGIDGWSFRVVGDGPLLLELQQKAISLGIYKNVEFVGGVNAEEVIEYLGSADVMLFSSESEGKPNVLIEGMATGLPIISSRISGVDELIQDGVSGLLYEFGDVASLRVQIKKVMNSSELRGVLGRKARRVILNEHGSWGTSAEKYREIFESISS